MSTEEHNIDPAQLEELLPMALFALFKLYCPEQEDIPQFICSLVWSMFSDQEMHYLITLSLKRGYMKIVLDRESWRLKILPTAAGVEFVKTHFIETVRQPPRNPLEELLASMEEAEEQENAEEESDEN